MEPGRGLCEGVGGASAETPLNRDIKRWKYGVFHFVIHSDGPHWGCGLAFGGVAWRQGAWPSVGENPAMKITIYVIFHVLLLYSTVIPEPASHEF